MENLLSLLLYIGYPNMFIFSHSPILTLQLMLLEFFFYNIFKLHGMPKSIVCDRDPTVTSSF